MENSYESLVVEDSSDKGEVILHGSFTERHMQAIWLEQKSLPSEFEVQGRKLIVLSSGIWNAEEGPDFKCAHFIWGNEEIRGDVELHLHGEYWQHHKHHCNSNYNNVVLHVVFYPSKKGKLFFKESGESLLELSLESVLTHPLKEVLSSIDLDLYPYRRCSGTGRCSESVFSRLTSGQINDFFLWAALWRLQRKAERLENLFNSPYEFWGGVSQVLGYKKNSETFSKLFLELSLGGEDVTENKALSWCLGRTAFFKGRFIKQWKGNEYYQELKSDWSEKGDFLPLKLSHIRPANHPIRRMVLLVKCRSFFKNNPLGLCLNLWNVGRGVLWDKNFIIDFKKEIELLFPVLDDSYWNTHYLFEVKSKKNKIPIIGTSLKKEIVVNVVLPLLWNLLYRKGMKEEEKVAFFDLYQSYPLTRTSKYLYLEQRLSLGQNHGLKCFSKASVEQGLYQLHYDFCSHYESSCLGCPFVNKFNQLISIKM